jgi:catechol 2,3-dioxygenase-like lactoylglutathione lyase family enzyme
MVKISHMVLPVTDLRSSRDWYVSSLGFKPVLEQDDVIGIIDEAGLTIFLRKSVVALPGEKITLTIQVENVEGKHRELASRGVKFVSAPKLQFWGYGAEVLDPDGYMNHLWDEVSMREKTRGQK